MEINLTLVIQMIVFASFVWFTMKFVWPPLMKALDERQQKIADGLSAAERGQRELELAQHRAKDEIKQARVQASDIIDKANHRAEQILDTAKADAKEEAQRLARLAQEQLAQEVSRAKEVLKQQMSALAVMGAEKILLREIDEESNRALVDNLIKEI